MFSTFKEGLGFLEGPVVAQDASLLLTAIDRGVVHRIVDDEVTLFARTGGGPNGLTEGSHGNYFVAQNGGSWPALNEIKAIPGVQQIARDGTIRSLGEGMKSPNDLAFGPDGCLYVTDPTRKPERDDGRVWRIDLTTGDVQLLLTCDWYPNGIGFSREDEWIYLADSRNARIVRLPIDLTAPREVETVIQMHENHPDGFAFDLEGNIAIAAPGTDAKPGNLQIWSSDWRLIEIIHPGASRYYTNIAIGADRVAYLTDSDGGRVLTATWPTPGLPLHPFRNNEGLQARAGTT